MLLDLARPWVIPVPVITGLGKIGDRYFPASDARHVGCRPSHAGQLVLDAEAGRLAPVPVGLINGTSYRGGSEPPLEPSRVIDALRHLLADPDARDGDILRIAGPPYSVTGCTVTGDLDALAGAGASSCVRPAGSPAPALPSPRTPANASAFPVLPSRQLHSFASISSAGTFQLDLSALTW